MNQGESHLNLYPIDTQIDLLQGSTPQMLLQDRVDGNGMPGGNFRHRLKTLKRLWRISVEPGTFRVRDGNESFYQLANLDRSEINVNEDAADAVSLLDLCPTWGEAAARSLHRRCVLYLVLRDLYQWEATEGSVADEPILLTFGLLEVEPRFVEFWLDFSQARVERRDETVSRWTDAELARLRNTADWSDFETQFDPDDYRVEGELLLEGYDITEREQISRLTQLLIDRESLLKPEKFQRVSGQLQALFQARDTLVLCVERGRVQVFFGREHRPVRSTRYSLKSLQNSSFLNSTYVDRAWSVPDLEVSCQTEFERSLLAVGIRSLLLIPAIVPACEGEEGNKQLAGAIGITSDRPGHFSRSDCQHASQLIPAFTCALRQALQQRVSNIRNIHPSVEWRFLQEAERRSWGFPAREIVFENVYPLYGISDIRGSSNERNRAIQSDLLEQFRLALSVIEGVCEAEESALTEQLRLDVLEYIDKLENDLTVDADVTAIEYLKTNIEIYFDYFAKRSPAAKAAASAYQNACDNEHQCVYVARAAYDRTLGEINTLLQESWERWQVRMQEIIPHYCDLEITDGIDRTIYAGKSIAPQFSFYHLRSLRYEQLRAMCDCARTAFSLQERYQTHLELTHLVLVQDAPIDIFHHESTEKLFDVKGTRDIRYEIVKKRIDKAVSREDRVRITQPGMLTIVYSTDEEWTQYQQYLRYLAREGWVDAEVQTGGVEPLQGISGLKFARVRVLEETAKE
ncbi:MAG: GAF domain-containing protein [Cyanobacteriota bacterium]|nr:GAF domain-containing protein [Cyanobacteriota bacterium]